MLNLKLNHNNRELLHSYSDVNDDKRLSKSSKWMIGSNEKTMGKTPPPMRRSLTVMNNYNDDTSTMDIVDGWASLEDESTHSNTSLQTSTNASTMLDLKRANVRRKLCQSASQRNIENLNMRPDTAFPRSRGLVPK